ncbi:hypothetical protein EDI_124990 [Entamoeba dispar SAW760]|uniref:Uncharacterized protein n=1 Tax=Entamoeba dispar (strain ATCC PRA-260 / SAW760) TaxID=370354 RepID=B0EC35_ENTDS|nr:uncharacterized protein EDI_124990 [Entamoeba dispar SAW760]EDR27883.1 hypothetical protein EDI_124990 [Entamoeba dispar SAW760]|eukprot:EDR27883.1 hypothetical protein EDI_124990 [Entamoeba dispar SAW760]
MNSSLIPKRVNLLNFALRANKGNLVVLLKSLLIPTTSYNIIIGNSGIATCSLALSALIDHSINTFYNEPSMAPLLSNLLDKLLLGTTVVSLSCVNRVPPQVASNIFARDVLLSVGSLLHRYLAFPHPIEWDKFFDTSQYTSFTITPTYFGRLNTSMTTLLTICVLLNWTFKPPVTRAFVSFLPKVMDFCSIFSFIEYFLPPAIPKPRSYGVFSSLFI